MSTVDNSNIKVGNTLNLEQLITNLNALGAQTQSAFAGAGNTASGTLTTHNSKTFSVSADDLILFHANVNFSISDGASSTGRLALFANSVQVGSDMIIGSDNSNTTGLVESIGLSANCADLSGSITFELKYSKNSGTGTIYIGNSYLWFEVIKRRA